MCSRSFRPLSVFPFKEAVEIERLRHPALLTLDQRSTKRSQLGLMFLKQTQAGADHLARGAIATLGNLEINKVAEMLAQGDGGVLGHTQLCALDMYQYIRGFW